MIQNGYSFNLGKVVLGVSKAFFEKKQKTYGDWKAKGYINDPTVSFIIQSHNKSVQVKHVVNKLRNYPRAEIVVIDDGSDYNHHISLMRF